VRDERQQLRYLILYFSQGLLLLQLIATFFLSVPQVQAKILVISDYSMIFDMFGVLLTGMPKYAVVLH